MDLHIHLEGRSDLARQIYEQLRDAILSGRLRRGDRLPPTRQLALRLDVSRNTVSLAYEWLTSEGFLTGHKGAGSFVDRDSIARSLRARAGVAIRHREIWDSIDAPAPREQTARYDFSVGMPDAALFPFDTWRRLLSRQIRPSLLKADYGDPAGHPKLRAAIARYVAVNRGVIAGADDVLITNGAQQAFDLIARVLIVPGTRVVVEEPGYPPPRLLFESLGARVTAVLVDASGLDVEELPDDTRLVYVTPSHQFPLGMPMSHARREALLQWAERRNAILVEDDYDSEFRFGGRPLETLQAIDRGGRVIHVGSFSKSLLPALRLGFVIAPASLQAPLRAASYVAGWYAQWPAQAALASLIDEGLLARHVRKMRRTYADRHDRILRTLTANFGKWLVPVPSVTGMHLAATLRSRSVRLEHEIAKRALAEGIAFDRLSNYCTSDHPRAGVVLGYGAIAASKIDEGLQRLHECFVRIYAPSPRPTRRGPRSA